MVDTISLTDFQRMLETGKSVKVIDVRTAGEFARVHAAGAQSMPLDQLDIPSLTGARHDLNEAIYVICQSGGRASKACQRLKEAGIGPVFNIEGGTDAWERMGLPVERGQGGVISIERQIRIVAGMLVFVGTALAWKVHPLFLIIPAFISAGQVFAGISNYCGMGLLLARMPWNRK